MGLADFIPVPPLDLVDDFYWNDSTTDGALSQLDWETAALTNGGTLAFQTAGDNVNYGVLRHSTGTTADGDGLAFRLFQDGLTVRPGTIVYGRVRLVTSVAGNNLRIGLMDTQTATEPAVGTWIDVDAGVTTVQADSANGDNSSATIFTATAGQWFRFKLVASDELNTETNAGPEWVTWEIIDEATTPAQHTGRVRSELGSDETAEFSMLHWQDTGSGADRIAEFDYVGLWVPRLF